MRFGAQPITAQKHLGPVAIEGHGPQAGEAIAGHHLAADAAHQLQIATGTLGNLRRAKHHQFGRPAAHRHHHAGAQVGLADQAGIEDLLIGHGAGKATHAAGPGQQGHLVELVGVGHQGGEQGMAHLVVGD